jgi:hypothetical protein
MPETENTSPDDLAQTLLDAARATAALVRDAEGRPNAAASEHHANAALALTRAYNELTQRRHPPGVSMS